METNYKYVEQIIEHINHLKIQRRTADTQPKTGRGTGFVLSYLHNNGDKIIPSELGKIMNVTTPRVTAILNKLEAKKLIVRAISPEDRRNVFVILSDQGKEVVEEKIAKQQQNIQTLVERLDESDVESFIRVLNELETVIDEQGWGL